MQGRCNNADHPTCWQGCPHAKVHEMDYSQKGCDPDDKKDTHYCQEVEEYVQCLPVKENVT